MADGSGFFAELKRRHVWRVAVAYAIVGWLIVQIATQVFPAFHMPDWTAQFVVILVAIGFPIAIVLAWAFELTPEGIRRTEPAGSPSAREARDTHAIGHKLNTLIIVVLVVAVALLLANTFIWHKGMRGAAVAMHPNASAAQPTHGPDAAQRNSGPAVLAKSIAVLPFQNLSNDKDNDYFVAGMQDLILTKLADIGDLKVISRTSTMQYGSHPENLTTVGQQLDVATILEGSVQKQGNQVLVNVQLINVATDGHIWAESYTRTLDNVFGVEGEVASKIADALSAKLSPAQSAQLAAVPTTNKAAYDLFLRAEYQSNKGLVNYDTASWKAAIPLYRQAVAQDPNFALAWARLSYNESLLAWFGGGGLDVKQLNQQARADAERALQLQPNLSAAHLAVGYSEYWGHGDYAAALQAFSAALALKPNDADALAAQAYVERRQGRFDDAIASLQQSLSLDPRNSALAFELGLTYMNTSRYAEAENAFQRALALDPDNRNAKSNYASAILLSTGDVPRALAAAEGDDPFLKLQRVGLLIYERKYPEALALLDSIPDTRDNFPPGVKAQQQADLYLLMGDSAHAKPLYAQALPKARVGLGTQQGINLTSVWQAVADDELGLGHTAEGLDAVGKAQAIDDKSGDKTYGPRDMAANAALYAEASRADLAVPLLAKALASPGNGAYYSPLLLWLDPLWDPIRKDPRFEALLQQYAKYKPAVTYDSPPAANAASAQH